MKFLGHNRLIFSTPPCCPGFLGCAPIIQQINPMDQEIESLDIFSFEQLKKLFTNLPLSTQQKILSFSEAVHQYNQRYNITAFKSPAVILQSLLLETLWIKYWYAQLGALRAIDVGSGAGVPGFILALIYPNITLDSIDKSPVKIAFQKNCCQKLGVHNLFAHAMKISDWANTTSRHQPNKSQLPYDLLFARAYKPLPQLFCDIKPLIGEQTKIILWKGMQWQNEWPTTGKVNFRLVRQLAYSVPHHQEQQRKSMLLEFSVQIR